MKDNNLQSNKTTLNDEQLDGVVGGYEFREDIPSPTRYTQNYLTQQYLNNLSNPRAEGNTTPTVDLEEDIPLNPSL